MTCHARTLALCIIFFLIYKYVMNRKKKKEKKKMHCKLEMKYDLIPP